MRLVGPLAVCLLAAPAVADPSADVAKVFDGVMSAEGTHEAGLKFPRLAMMLDLSYGPGVADSWYELGAGAGLPARSKVVAPIAGIAGDGKAAWIAADLAVVQACETIHGGAGGGAGDGRADYCDKGDPKAWLHGAALVELDGKRWQPVALHVAGRRPGAKAETAKLDAFDNTVEHGAEDAVKALEAALHDPKQLGALVADRDGVAMFGSDKGERFAGAAAVRSTLATWGFAFVPVDHVAGLTASKTVAWVAENVRAEKKGTKPSTYRLLAILERGKDGWKLVQLSFAATEKKP